MKKTIVVGALALFAAGSANATALCTGTSAGGPVNFAVTSGNFVINTFSMKCSSNVFLDYAESTTAVGVGTASAKGKNVFSGNSGGGQVKPTGTTCTGACTNTQSAAAATAALTDAGT